MSQHACAVAAFVARKLMTPPEQLTMCAEEPRRILTCRLENEDSSDPELEVGSHHGDDRWLQALG